MNLFLALAGSLQKAGHEPVFFGIPSIAKRVQGEGFGFYGMVPTKAAADTLDKLALDIRTLDHGTAMGCLGKFEYLRYQGILECGPRLVGEARLEAMVVDQADACSGSLAEKAGLPWVSVCNGLPVLADPNVPPFYSHRLYSRSWPSQLMNRVAHFSLRLGFSKKMKLINGYRKSWGLTPLGATETNSPFATLSQQIAEFDFPDANPSPTFHYVGPLWGTEKPYPFPWERLDGRPILYASLGTVVSRQAQVYRIILEACSGLNHQLVLSLGGNRDLRFDERAAGDSVIVDYAPQRQLIARSAAFISHAGLNSALESFSEGVPLVGIPLAFDQPGVAARVRWTGAGEFILSAKLEPGLLRRTIQKVVDTPSYRENAQRISTAIARAGGLEESVRVIELVIETGRPYHRPITPTLPASDSLRPSKY